MIVRQDFEERLQGWKWRQKHSQAGRLHADCGSWRSVLTSGRFDVGRGNLLRDKPGGALGMATGDGGLSAVLFATCGRIRGAWLLEAAAAGPMSSSDEAEWNDCSSCSE